MKTIKVVVEENYSEYSISELKTLFDDYYAMYRDDIESLSKNGDFLAIEKALKEKGFFSE